MIKINDGVGYSDLFLEMIEKKYAEMKMNAVFEDFLNFESLGGIKIFINRKPKYMLYCGKIDNDQIYVGSESL